MTAPVPDPQEAADALADHLLALTAGASRQATADVDSGVKLLVAAMVARWVLEFGSTDGLPGDTALAAGFVEHAAGLLAQLTLDPAAQAAFELAVEDAYQLGREHARRFAPPSPGLASRSLSHPLPVLSGVLDQQRAQAILGLDERALVESGFPVVVQSMAKVQRAATRIEANVAYEVTRSANTAVRDATPAGWSVMWVAERTACLHCLAYAGEHRLPHEAFPSGLTFADKSMRHAEPVFGPPKHPHCRCSLQPLHPDDTAVSDGLKREARRSVLRGWADDESQPARLRAAGRLLTVGAGLPPTVENRARTAVRDGRFN